MTRDRQRLLVSFGAGAFGVLLVWYATHVAWPARPTDFDQVWFAGRTALAGRNPYTEIGPGRAFELAWPYFYPMTAPVVVAPLLALPLAAARYVFVFLGAALLAWGVTRTDWHHLPLFLGAPFVVGGMACQWSALLTAAICLPALAWVYAAKPNLGLAQLIAYPSPRGLGMAAAGTLMAVALATVIAPSWIREWLGLTRVSMETLNTEPMLLAPGGVLMLLALLRWRRPEARLTAALTIVPLSVVSYSYLPLALVAETRIQSLSLALLSWGPWLVPVAMDVITPDVGSRTLMKVLYLLFQFAPALVLVLRRPNAMREGVSG